MRRTVPAALTVLTLLGVAHCAAAQESPGERASSEPVYAGLSLAAALERLRARGLRLLYGSNVVEPRMRVEEEPPAGEPAEVLELLLRPHGLTAVAGAGGILTVVPVPTGAVRGRVRGPDGDRPEGGGPIAGAEVRALAPPRGRERAVRTDAEGRFLLEDLAPGRRTLEVRLPGWVLGQREVEVESGREVAVEIRLEPAPVTFDEIEVTPSRYGLLGSETAPGALWTRRDVGRLPHLSDDLFRAISRLPGVAAGDFSADFHVRGGEKEEVLVLLDGLRVYEPYHLKDFQNVFSIFDSNAVGSVEVISGGFPAEYGDRMSGVVEIASGVPTARRTLAGVSFEKMLLLSEGPLQAGDGHWLFAARRGYLDLLLDAAGADFDDDFVLEPTYYDLFAKLQRRLAPNVFLTVDGLGALDQLVLRNDEEDDRLASRYGNYYLWARLDSLHGRLAQSSIVSYGRVDRDRDGHSGANLSDLFGADELGDLTVVSDRRRLDAVELRSSWTLETGRHQHWKAGAELRRLAADYDYRFVNRTSDPVFGGGPVDEVRRTDLAPDGWTYGLYAADRLRLGARLTVELGLRWDRQTYAGDEQLSPRVNVAAAVSRTAVLRAAWGLYHQAQGLHELQVEDGVERFFPAQRNEQLVVGFERPLTASTRLALQLYRKRLTDLRPRFENLFEPFDIFPEGQSDRVRIDAEEARARGAELSLHSRYERLDWWASYTWSEAEDRTGGDDVPRSWDQRHALSYSVNLRLGRRWNLNLAGVHHSGQPTTEVFVEADAGGRPVLVLGPRNRGRLPDYHRVDLRVSRELPLGAAAARGTLTLFFEVSNLLDRDNVRGVSDFDVRGDPGGGFAVEPELEHWLPRLPSFGLTWTL